MMSSSGRKASILDRPLSKAKTEINVTTFAFLFSEMVSYCEKRASTTGDLQVKLHSMGYEVGTKVLDVNYFRERGYKRETNLLKMLQFIQNNIWKSLFGKEADGLSLDKDNKRIYYLVEKDPLVNTYISLPRDRKKVNCASFSAGIVEAILKGSNFNGSVSAHWNDGMTYYRIEFDDDTIAKAS